MTKLIQQLSFSSSNYYYDVAGTVVEPQSPKEKSFYGDGGSMNEEGNKRSALSASDAECFSLCLGAGPLCDALVSTRERGPDVPAHGSAPPGGVSSGAAGPALPSAPVHDDSSHDLLSALLWGSASSLSSSSESLTSDSVAPTHPALQPSVREEVIKKILDRKNKQPVKIDLKIFLTENVYTRWEAVVKGTNIYLRVPGVMQSGSKESFILLLDFAEERLGCTDCIICILKNRSDRATLLRTFMFMGFQMLPPTSPLMQEINNPEYIFLHYSME